MASGASLQTIGNWKAKVQTTLSDALMVSMDVMGRTGEEACKHAIILMAQSAAAQTKKAPARRVVQRDPRLANSEYVEAYNQGSRTPSRLYRWQFFGESTRPGRILGTWENAKRIGNSGLAKRSWMWGLNRLGGRSKTYPIPGTSRVYSINTPTVNGYVKENKLGYIMGAIASGWESSVVAAATNKIMSQARLKMERQWQSAIRRGDRAIGRGVQSFFVRGLA